MNRRRLALFVIGAVSVTAICALLFGPARGARDDIAHVRTDLHGSRQGIYGTLNTQLVALQQATQQLGVTERSLEVQQQGLSIARHSEQLARSTSDHTADLLDQTTSTLTMVRRIITDLGPLQQVGADVHAALRSVEAGAALARTALDVARQTLSTGREALSVAVATLRTLQHSEDIQSQQLDVARETLEQTREINRKLALLPVLPAPPVASSSTG